MKKTLRSLLVAAFAMAASLSVEAQYYYLPGTGGNPGNLNNDDEYPVGGGLSTTWSTLFTGPAATPVWTSPVTIPFAFSFNGAPVTSYKVATSGVLTFTTSATAVPPATNTALPNPNIPDNSVTVWGLQANSGDFIVTKTFGTAPNRQHWVMFNSYSKPNSSLWTYWSIVLEETTNKIYIVDQRTSGTGLAVTAGIQIDANTAYMVSGSPSLGSTTSANPAPADNRYFAFTPGTQPAFDMSVDAINTAPYQVLASAPYTINGIIKNFGTTPVTSFTLNYSVDNGPAVSAVVSPTNISTLGTFAFSHTTPWAPTATGTYNVKVWATDINGSNADQMTSNDTLSKTIQVVTALVNRTVLHEVFTSSTCPPCKPGNENLHNITTANPNKSIDIKYQQDFPAPGNDPYQTPESIARRGYYGINSIPRMEVDGGWDGNANSYTTGLLNNFQSKPSFMAINATHTQNGTAFNVDVTIDPKADFSSQNLTTHVVITERRTVGNARTNGETVFYDVMKKMLPNQNGTPIAPLVSGTARTLNLNYTFPAGHTIEHLDSLRVVVFVQDNVTKEVFQSAYSTKVSGPTGVAEAALENAVALYPNPTEGRNVNLEVNLETAENVQVKVVNTLGQVIYTADKGKMAAGRNTLSLDLAGQAKGIYFVNVTVGGKTVTKKLSLTL